MNREIIISPNTTIMNALRKMDEIDRKLLIVCSGERFIGVVSIGDIQRAILKKVELSERVQSVMRNEILYAHNTDNIEDIKGMMKKERIECMPILDSNENLIDVIEWSSLFENDTLVNKLDNPVVIMAGGKGERLKPLTNIIPKPLIPVSDKTIIEEIMSRFVKVNCVHFYLSVNYMADDIEKYFNKQKNLNYTVDFIHENVPLGTAGSLFLVKEKINKTFFVSNCDILVDINLSDLMEYHISSRNIATIVSVVKSTNVPYGILETIEGGILDSIKEKPEMTYQINSGLYILEPEILNLIEPEKYIDITDLLMLARKQGKKVGVFPVSEGAWMDMGNWEEYLNMIKNIG